jgi:hypothetical protein
VCVANNHRSQLIGKGTVTLNIQNYLDDSTIYLQLVPDLHKRLISTDKLNNFQREVRHHPSYVGLYLHETNGATTVITQVL